MRQGLLKTKITERYAKIPLTGNSDCCCTHDECCNTTDYNPKQSSIAIGYDDNALESIPDSSVLGLGCGAPVKFADLKEGQTVLDLGSGAGIDVFLASSFVKDSGR
jgi:arsenite methyltransferase